MLAEILIIFLLFLVNGAFSMAEMAVVASSKARLRVLIEEGRTGARAALELAENPNRLLSSVQIGITLIATLTGALGGATIAEELAIYIKAIPAAFSLQRCSGPGGGRPDDNLLQPGHRGACPQENRPE